MGRHETETRQQILEACVALIEQAGGQRLRVKDIAEDGACALASGWSVLRYYIDSLDTLNLAG